MRKGIFARLAVVNIRKNKQILLLRELCNSGVSVQCGNAVYDAFYQS